MNKDDLHFRNAPKMFKILIFQLIVSNLFGQDHVSFSILPQWQGKTMVLDSTYILEKTHLISIDVCKLYISNITFLMDDIVLHQEESRNHLLDAELPESFYLDFYLKNSSKINRVRFNLGIDSLTNVAGAMGGDLDPTKGMYWTWQTGYINAKIEGKSSISTARNNSFIFHLGGHKEPFAALKTIELPVKNDENKISLSLDLSSFIKSIELSTLNNIMSPSSAAVKVSELLAKNFKSESQ